MDGIATPDGRLVAYREFGDPDGVPVVNCHGGLLCGLDVEPADSTARRMGIRLISPDRPGVGFSTNVPNRTTADWAGDVAALADALDLGRFGAWVGQWVVSTPWRSRRCCPIACRPRWSWPVRRR